MARTNNLTDFLTDVANAIKNKKGDTTDIPASEFDTEITNLPSQGIYQSKQMTINTNGNYEIISDDGYDAIERLRLNINVGTADTTYAELFAIADNIYNPSVPDDSATANFTINDEQVCLQRALKILKGVI